MAEFHKMAGVINGVAQCFAMEDQECELCGPLMQTSLIPRLCGLYGYEAKRSQYHIQLEVTYPNVLGLRGVQITETFG